jgi:hypothetical protein
LMLGPMVPVSSRLTPNPCIGVCELMQPLVAFQKLHGGEADVAKLIIPKNSKAISWKTAPNVAWLVGMKSLLEAYLKIATNAVLPSKKHKSAITKLCIEKMPQPLDNVQLNKTKYSADDFSDLIDMYIRIACAQLRVLRTDEVAMARALQKASSVEQEALKKLLDLIDPESKVPNPASSSKAVPPIPSSWQVVVAEKQQEAAVVVPAASTGSVLNPSIVFQRILEKRVSDSLSPVRLAVSDSQPINKQKSFLDSVLGEEEEAALLAAARMQEPLAKGNKSLLARIRANHRNSKKSAPKKKKGGNSKTKAMAIKKGSKPKPAKKPNAVPWKPSSRIKGKQSAPESSEDKPALPTPSISAAGVDKATQKKRALSNAYHKARVAALKEAFEEKPDMTDEEKKAAVAAAKTKAQEAYKAAAAAFEK